MSFSINLSIHKRKICNMFYKSQAPICQGGPYRILKQQNQGWRRYKEIEVIFAGYKHSLSACASHWRRRSGLPRSHRDTVMHFRRYQAKMLTIAWRYEYDVLHSGTKCITMIVKKKYATDFMIGFVFDNKEWKINCIHCVITGYRCSISGCVPTLISLSNRKCTKKAKNMY